MAFGFSHLFGAFDLQMCRPRGGYLIGLVIYQTLGDFTTTRFYFIPFIYFLHKRIFGAERLCNPVGGGGQWEFHALPPFIFSHLPRFRGWWYNACYAANLNGLYRANKQLDICSYTGVRNGLEWIPWKYSQYSMKKVEIKIFRAGVFY